MTTYQKLTLVRYSKDFDEATEIQTVETVAPAAGEILVRNQYAGVNAADTMMIANEYLFPIPLPCDLGVEAVGEVVEVGEGVTDVKPGDPVLINGVGVGYREYAVVKAGFYAPIPMATPEIMSLSVGGLTASLALSVTGEMRSDETVLVTAAAGGTGQFAVQLAKLAGNHVIGTCSSDDKVEMLKALGCDRVVNYKQENLAEVLKAEYPKGVNLVFESVGRDLFDICVNNLARFGRLVTIGFISEYQGEPERVNAARIYYKILGKNASIRGFNLNLYFTHPQTPEHMARLVELMSTGKLNPVIDPTDFHGVGAVGDAITHMRAGGNTGKITIRL